MDADPEIGIVQRKLDGGREQERGELVGRIGPVLQLAADGGEFPVRVVLIYLGAGRRYLEPEKLRHAAPQGIDVFPARIAESACHRQDPAR